MPLPSFFTYGGIIICWYVYFISIFECIEIQISILGYFIFYAWGQDTNHSLDFNLECTECENATSSHNGHCDFVTTSKFTFHEIQIASRSLSKLGFTLDVFLDVCIQLNGVFYVNWYYLYHLFFSPFFLILRDVPYGHWVDEQLRFPYWPTYYLSTCHDKISKKY